DGFARINDEFGVFSDVRGRGLMLGAVLSKDFAGQAGAILDHAAEQGLLTLQAAYMMDTVGNKIAQSEIAQIKVVAPNVALKVIDRAIQMHGGAGVSNDFPLAYWYAMQRTLRLADGPDEVHRAAIGKFELGKYVPREMLRSSR
ncbi:MAG: acyl-CoA dehydrogenase family protein, partial [Pseudomonas aeruginosa]|nr:acyl-CoA dehydrogenase family protein [Pseudomonas aeruginosa]